MLVNVMLPLVLLASLCQAQPTTKYQGPETLEQQVCVKQYDQLNHGISNLQWQYGQGMMQLQRQMTGGHYCQVVEELVSGPSGVADSQITASSEWDHNSGAHRGRLHSVEKGKLMGAWSAGDKDTQPWIKVDFNRTVTMLGVVTKGRNSRTYVDWVKSFQVLYSNNGVNWTPITDDQGDAKNFTGNYDMETAVTNSWYLQGKGAINA